MKLGILNAFPPDENIINWHGTPVDAYIRFLELVQPPFDYVGYDIAGGQFPDPLDACDAYLITGSPKGVYDADVWIAELAAFIRDAYQAGKKLVGICFGHQILAHALGGQSERSDKGWGLGLKTFNISEQKSWMIPGLAQCSLYFIHQDQVVHLPPGAELLGGNTFCPNLFFTIDDRVLGIQGHPEFSVAMMKDVLEARKVNLGKQVYQAVMRSVDNGKPDNRLMAQWVVNFLLIN